MLNIFPLENDPKIINGMLREMIYLYLQIKTPCCVPYYSLVFSEVQAALKDGNWAKPGRNHRND